MKNIVSRIRRVLSPSIPEYSLYYRVGMYHFGMVSNVSSSVDDEISRFTSAMFRGLNKSGMAGDDSQVVLDRLQHSVQDKLVEMKRSGMHKVGDVWFADGEYMRDPAIEDIDGSSFFECSQGVNREREVIKRTSVFKEMMIEMQICHGDMAGRILASNMVSLCKRKNVVDIVNLRHIEDTGEESVDEFFGTSPPGEYGSISERIEFLDPDVGRERAFWYGFDFTNTNQRDLSPHGGGE